MKSIAKTIWPLLLFLAIFEHAAAQSSKVTKSFQVQGNCEMCKATIEEAVWVKGVKKARWDIKSKMLTITFDSVKISENELHNLIASEGYDTEKVKADDSVYNKLPECCLYRSGPGSMNK
jgi:copper chaperone CopZ